MAFIQEHPIHISLEAKRSYRIIHFSDVHCINLDKNQTPDEYEKAIKNEEAWLKVRKDFANYFHEVCNEEHRIPSCKCLDNLLQFVQEQKPDAFIMTGDIIDYYSKANLKYLEESLKNFSIPFILTYGNHESPVTIFDYLTNSHSEFQVLEFPDFKIIGLDDSNKKISSKQLKLLKEQLQDNKKVFISMHIPVMTKMNEEDMQKYDSYFIIDYKNCDETTKEFIETLENNDSISAIFCGHTHGASESFFAKNKKQYCASSGLIGYVNTIFIH